MANGFETHGITHLSASSINLWTNAPDVWVLEKLAGVRTPGSPAMQRGICAEDAVVDALQGASVDDAIAKAEKKFDSRFPLAVDEAVTKERQNIRPIVEQALPELEGYGAPVFVDGGKQEKIKITAKGENYAIDVIGYLDLVFPDHGLVVDLKTTMRIPSQMSPEHQLQRAIYAKAKGNFGVKFLYVSPKKTAWLEDGEPFEMLAKAKKQIDRLERFLRHVPDAQTALSIVPHAPNSFFWRGAETIRDQHFA